MIVSPINSSIFASAATVLSTFLDPVQKINLYPWEGENVNDTGYGPTTSQ